MAVKPSPLPMQQHRDLAELSIGIVVGIGLVLTLLALFAVPFAGSLAGAHDFVEYWAAGRQLTHHGNPYDTQVVAALEHAAGWKEGTFIIMPNPPWILPLVYPLGFLGLRTADLLWTLLLLACVIVSVRSIRILHGNPPNQIHWLAFAITPVVLSFAMGQSAVFAMLGYVLFLRFHRDFPFLSGAALWLCALKPHLFLPLAAALIAWIVTSRNFKVLAGAAAAFTVSVAAAFLIDPHAWPQYITVMHAPAVTSEFTPSIADALRHWIDPQASWFRFLPAALCCIWAPVYFWRRRFQWDWVVNGNLLLLVSVVFAPYGWVYDQCCLLPALLHGAYIAKSRNSLTALALLILLADIQLCCVATVSPLGSPLWIWTGPAWLVWYLSACASAEGKATQPAQAPA